MMTNYIVRVDMDREEAKLFGMLSPIVGLGMSSKEHTLIAKLLGYKSMSDLVKSGIRDNPYLKQAAMVLSFLHASSDDREQFRAFFDKLVFTDKDVEKRVRRTYNVRERNTLSPTTLEVMYNADCDVEEWDDAELF